MAADTCGATSGGLTCDRGPGHEGDHRGYLEAVDEVLFWNGAACVELATSARELQALLEHDPVFLDHVLGMDQPWPLLDVLERLAAAADHLLAAHSCDHLGYEGINAARDAARAHVERLRGLLEANRA